MALSKEAQYKRTIRALQNRITKVENEGGRLPQRVYNLLESEYSPQRLKAARNYTVTKLRQVSKYKLENGKVVNYEQLKNIRRHKRERERKKQRQLEKLMRDGDAYVRAISNSISKLRESFAIGGFKMEIADRLQAVFEQSLSVAKKGGEEAQFYQYLSETFDKIQYHLESVEGVVYLDDDTEQFVERDVRNLVYYLGSPQGYSLDDAELETADIMDSIL